MWRGFEFIIGAALIRIKVMPHHSLRWPFLFAFLSLAWLGRILPAVVDNQLWTALVLQKGLPGKFDLEINQDIRSKDNISTFKKSITEIGLFYNFNKHLNTSVDYRYIIYSDKTGRRVSLTGRYKLTVDKFSHQYRAKFQQEIIEGDETENNLRHKYTVRYRRETGLSPYIAIELFYLLGESRLDLLKSRVTLGVRKKLTQRNTVKLYYRIQQEVDTPDPDRTNIFGFEFEISLKSGKRRQDSPNSQP